MGVQGKLKVGLKCRRRTPVQSSERISCDVLQLGEGLHVEIEKVREA